MGVKAMTRHQETKETGDTHIVTLVEAVTLALRRAMQDSPDVIILGEDVGTNGGVFRATEGLKAEFGYKRVIDTPLAESLIASANTLGGRDNITAVVVAITLVSEARS